MALDSIGLDIWWIYLWIPSNTETYCKQINDILDLERKKIGTLRFQFGVIGWWNDSDIHVPYTISVIAPRHWQDMSSCDEINIEIWDFSWIHNWKKIWSSEEEQISIELYFEEKWIDLRAEVKKVYIWEL